MKKAISIFFVAVLALGIVGPVNAESRLVGAAGITQSTADGLYGSLAGEAAWAGTQDFTGGSLLAAVASAANEVMTQGASDARYAELSGATFTGVVLLPDGSSGAPSWGYASETGTGGFLAKAGGRHGWTADGVGTIMTLGPTVGLVIDTGVTLGNAIGDVVTVNAGAWNIINLLTANFSSDYVLNVGANIMTINAATGGLVINAPVIFDGTIEVKGTDGIEFSPGADVNALFLAPQIVGGPTLGWVDASKSWEFVEPLIVENAAIATHALNRQTGDARYVQTRSPITISFAGGTDPHADTNSTTYTAVGIFLFGGTTALGTPTKIKAIGFIDASGTSWDFRILDITNATTIVEKTGNTGTVAEIVDAGALSNLPAAEAMFEAQLKRTGGGGATEAHMYSLTTEF